jgi:hypothetical protein
MTQMTQEINLQRHGRPHIQFGGPRPNNRVFYYGGDTNYVMVGDSSTPVRGGVDPLWVRDPFNLDAFVLSGRQTSAPDLPTVGLTFREKIGSIPRQLLASNCLINVYLARGQCRDLSDLRLGWESYVKIFSGGRVTDRSTSGESSFDGDDPIETEVELSCEAIYPAGSVAFSERIASSITLEVLDITYGNRTQCGECGPTNDGAQWIYAVEKGGAAAKPIVWYSLDGGSTWASSSVSTAANAEAPCAIRLMGGFLVVLSPTAGAATQGGYYYSAINPVTGAPSATWTKVTTGFVATFEPRDMWVAGPKEAYICCDSGEILRITDVPTGATSLGIVTSADLSRIHGNADSIVAVGASATVVRSLNRGTSFAVTTTAPGAATLNAVNVLDRNRIWVGNSSGVVYYSLDGGESWVTQALGVTPSAIQDIRFTTQECGYIAYTASSLGRIAATIDGGVSWVTSDVTNPRVIGVPTTVTQRYNRIAYPIVNDAGIRANYASLAGLGLTTDGALMVGAGNVF